MLAENAKAHKTMRYALPGGVIEAVTFRPRYDDTNTAQHENDIKATRKIRPEILPSFLWNLLVDGTPDENSNKIPFKSDIVNKNSLSC